MLHAEVMPIPNDLPRSSFIVSSLIESVRLGRILGLFPRWMA